MRERLEGLDRGDVVAALRDAGGNVGRAAKMLGASRRTLQSRMRDYGIPEGRAGRRRRKLNYRSRRMHRNALIAIGAVIGAVAIGARMRQTS